MTYWLSIGARKPLAHLPRWRRYLLYLPAVRWRLWPRPWNFNGPPVGWREQRRRDLRMLAELHELCIEVANYGPVTYRDGWVRRANAVLVWGGRDTTGYCYVGQSSLTEVRADGIYFDGVRADEKCPCGEVATPGADPCWNDDGDSLPTCQKCSAALRAGFEP